MVKLLVIDDDLALCDLLKDHFSQKDYEVFIATNGEEALSIVKEKHPNIILLDVVITNESGLDILLQIKAINDKAKIIMISGVKDKSVIKLANRYGASDYITKPFSLEHLEKEIIPKILKQLI